MDFTEAYDDTCSSVGGAARNGDLGDLQRLIWHGRAVDVKDNRGWRPIHEAAFNGHPGCLEFLLRQGDVDPDWKTFEEETAILLAARRGHFECVRTLLEYEANPNIATNEGFTPLWEAVQSESQSCVRLLTRKDANINARVYTGYTPLHLAAEKGHFGILQYLINHGANITACADEDLTPLFLAAQFGHTDCLRLILKALEQKGMCHAEAGQQQMKNFLSTLEIGDLHGTSMKARELEISPNITAVAQRSCSDALKETSIDGSNETPLARQTGEFKYDIGQQKKGSRRAYGSKSGVRILIRNKKGKVCACGVRIRKCQYYQSKGKTPPPHVCHKNWSGSSKAMKPDVRCQLVKTVEEKGVDVNVINMDDDTTTMAHIRTELTDDITKWSVISHTSKHLTYSLCFLQKKHKLLTTSVIKYLKKCFNYALAHNKGDADKCRSAILQIVPHAFSEHSGCGSWCGYTQNPEIYPHSSITNDLTGEKLREDLTAVFQVFANNADKLAQSDSTKYLKSFNNMVATKTLKRCHFSLSSSLKSQADCTVTQKNIGNSNINEVNFTAGLTSGKLYHENATKQGRVWKRPLEYLNRTEVKKRKITNKLQKQCVKSAKERRKGVPFQSPVATSQSNDNNIHVEEIPEAIFPPLLQPVSNGVFTKIFCDIETSSLLIDADILQISAICGSDVFNQYITPTKSVAPGATAVNGLTAQGGVLFLHGAPVTALPLRNALHQFIAWLDDRAPAILIGHNFRKFDFPRIIRAIDSVNLNTAFKKRVVGAVDTLPLFKEIYPDRRGCGVYTQKSLVSDILHETYEAHNAVSDVESLQKLFVASNISNSLFFRHSFTTSWGLKMLEYHQVADRNIATMKELAFWKIIPKATLEKIGGSGLNYQHLKLAYNRCGFNGLTNLLSEKINGRVRVTSSKRVIAVISRIL